MNGLRDMLYSQPYATAQAAGGNGSTVGASFGFNVGSETFRVQLAISGIVLAAIVGLLWLHKKGNRFSVKV